MNEKEKAFELIRRLREANYNHAPFGFGKCMGIDEETAVELVEEIFEIKES